jgi:predicted DNA-binding transcriptional regulator YafY
VQALHQAFIDLETLVIRYTREDGATSERRIEPHYLLLKYPVWYVIAQDDLRAEPRTFRCDRIQAAHRDGASFQLRPKDAFGQLVAEDDLAL